MPRTEFVTLYAQVKGTLPGSDSLYNLIKVLACYRYYYDEIMYVQHRPLFVTQLTHLPVLTQLSVTALSMLQSLTLILMG